MDQNEIRYVVAPEFSNLFVDIKDKLLEFNTGKETISYSSNGPSKSKKQFKMQGGDMRYYNIRANKYLEDKIINTFHLKPHSVYILVTPKNFKGTPHIDLGKRDVILNILLQGTGKCYFNNSKEQEDINCFTDSHAFFFEGSKYHFVNNLNSDIERVVISINWFKKFTLNDIHEQSARTRLLF
tara:strand:- start:179 stop:727 length:549 start_codon:yes stop_codon:yes gene_type:complete